MGVRINQGQSAIHTFTHYEILLETADTEGGIPRSDARARLSEADYSPEDTEYTLERLLNRGYLYAVEERLFVTEHELNDT
jgi:hypothetical protein